MNRLIFALIAVAIVLAAPSFARAQGSDADLAKKLANPIASLISVPFQTNFDFQVGPAHDGTRQTVNFQPVIPFPLDDKWSLISRTILPIIGQDMVLPGAGGQFGFGDTLQSLFVVPPALPIGKGQFIYGFGPALLFPTGTDQLLSGRKWGAGPTFVGLAQIGGYTVGVLANHIWSYAGPRGRSDVDQTYIQPFVSYTTPSAWTYSISSEMTRDWTGDTWTIPVTFGLSKLTKLGNRPVSLGANARYYASTTPAGPHGWGFRMTLTFLFPTGG